METFSTFQSELTNAALFSDIQQLKTLFESMNKRIIEMEEKLQITNAKNDHLEQKLKDLSAKFEVEKKENKEVIHKNQVLREELHDIAKKTHNHPNNYNHEEKKMPEVSLLSGIMHHTSSALPNHSTGSNTPKRDVPEFDFPKEPYHRKTVAHSSTEIEDKAHVPETPMGESFGVMNLISEEYQAPKKEERSTMINEFGDEREEEYSPEVKRARKQTQKFQKLTRDAQMAILGSNDVLTETSNSNESYQLLRKNQRTHVDKDKPFIPDSIIEDFLIVAPSSEELKGKIDQENIPKSFKFPPTILWNEKGPDQMEVPKNQIGYYVFPFDTEVQDMTSLYGGEYDGLINKVLFKEKRYPGTSVFYLNSGKESTQIWDDKITLLNHDKKAYFVSIIINDYVIVPQKSKPNQPKKLKIQVAYIMMTFLPITPILTNLLKSIIDHFRHHRKVLYYSTSQPDALLKSEFYHSLEDFRSNFKKIIELAKEELKIPKYGKKIEINIKPGEKERIIKASFQCPQENEVSSCDAIWNSYLVFSYLNLDDLYFIFSAMLLEKTVVFFSKDVRLLTSTIGVLLSLMKPLKYTYPTIFNLPESQFGLLEAPLTVMVGINKGEDFFWEQNLIQVCEPGTIFFMLDEKKIYSLSENKKPLRMPVFNSFDQRLPKWYKEKFGEPELMKKYFTENALNEGRYAPKINHFENYDWDKFYSIVHTNRYYQSQMLFVLWKITMQVNITGHVNGYQWGDNEEKDVSTIKNQLVRQYFWNNDSKRFMDKFGETQTFSYFCQEMHDKYKRNAESQRRNNQ